MQRLFGAVLAGALALGSGAGARAETLADALISAYRHSNLLEQNQALLRAADEGVAQALAALRPVIAYSLSMNMSKTAVTGSPALSPTLSQTLAVTGSLTVYDFGRGEIGQRMAEENVLATRQALVSVEQDVLLSAVSAYVNLGLQTQTLALRQSNTRLIEQELAAVKDRFDVGETTRTEVAQAESLLASAQASEQAALGAVSLAQEDYRSRVGHAPGDLPPLPAAPKLPASEDEAKAIAQRRHPLILQSQSQLKLADMQVEMSKANFSPVIGASGSLSNTLSGSTGGRQAASLGLAMSQTIYSGGLKASQLREAIANADRMRAAARETGVILSESVGRAWSNISVATANIESTDKQVKAAQAVFEGVSEEASLGAKTSLDVLDAEQDVLNARFAKLQAEAQLYQGVYELLSAMGLLTVDHLGLGIPTYDVEAYYNLVKRAPAHSAQGAALDRILDSIGK
ncbi:MAG: TolC family outer membrane protein [Paracoccaceae bacterium]